VTHQFIDLSHLQQQSINGLNSMHPQRQTLHNELHARPSLYFDEPAHVFHLAFLAGSHSATRCWSAAARHQSILMLPRASPDSMATP